MKQFIITAFIVIAFVTCGFAQTGKMSSVYTSLSDKVCKQIKIAADEGGDYQGRCPGIGGYQLMLYEGDLRQTLDIIAPDKKSYKLDLWSVVSPQFSALGDKAEWRVTGAGKNAKPSALIVRYNASENMEHSEKTTSYLVVIKITRDEACVTDIVKPSANANVEARKLADAAANKPCKSAAE